MILKICSLKIGSESSSYKPKGILSTFFCSSIKQKERTPKRIWNFSFQTENFLCLFLIIIIIIQYHFYDFLSKSSMYRSHALFVWLFNILFTRYWKISCTCLTFMDLDLFLYPPFPFYLFFYRNQLSFLWLHFCMTWSSRVQFDIF